MPYFALFDPGLGRSIDLDATENFRTVTRPDSGNKKQCKNEKNGTQYQKQNSLTTTTTTNRLGAQLNLQCRTVAPQQKRWTHSPLAEYK